MEQELLHQKNAIRVVNAFTVQYCVIVKKTKTNFKITFWDTKKTNHIKQLTPLHSCSLRNSLDLVNQKLDGVKNLTDKLSFCVSSTLFFFSESNNRKGVGVGVLTQLNSVLYLAGISTMRNFRETKKKGISFLSQKKEIINFCLCPWNRASWIYIKWPTDDLNFLFR